LRRSGRAAEIANYHPHDLRHRRISLWHGQGVPVKEAAERSGHSKASMTLDRYSHVMPLEEVGPARYQEALAP
jgi:integrase